MGQCAKGFGIAAIELLDHTPNPAEVVGDRRLCAIGVGDAVVQDPKRSDVITVDLEFDFPARISRRLGLAANVGGAGKR